LKSPVLIGLIIMSFVHNIFGQNSFNLFVGSQFILAKDYDFNNSEPIQIGVGYSYAKSKIGFDAYLNYLGNNIKKSENLTELVRKSTYYDSRNVDIKNSFFGFGLGPIINFDFSEEFTLKLIGTYNMGTTKSIAYYSDSRNYVREFSDNRFETINEAIINRQSRNNKSLSSYIKVGIGASFFSNLPVGIELGWMNLDYGQTINNLNPDGVYTNKKIETKTNLFYLSTMLNLRKKQN
jgi:hypothetical protein